MKFRIGQRVKTKFVFNPRYAEMVGKEAVITEIDSTRSPLLYGLDISPVEIVILEDGPWLLGWSEDQLEPLSDSNDKITWEEMRDLWQPEEYRVEFWEPVEMTDESL